MNTMKKLVTLVTAAAMAGTMLVPAYASDQPKVELRIAHQSAETENIAIAFEKFKEELEAADVGFEVTIYPAAQLVASDRDAIEAISLGEVDVTSVADVNFPSTVPAFYLFSAEFLFDSIDDAQTAFYEDGLFEKLQAATEETGSGIKLISMWANGGRALWIRGNEVRKPDDLKGVPLRCAENDIAIAEMEALGAVPVTMAWSEIYTGLEQGTINGLFSTKNAIVQQGFTAVLDYAVDTNHSFGHAAQLVNAAKYDSFTDEQKAAFDAAMKAATDEEWEMAKATEADIDQKIEEQVTYIHLTDEERQAIADVMIGATEDLVKQQLGDKADILEEVRNR